MWLGLKALHPGRYPPLYLPAQLSSCDFTAHTWADTSLIPDGILLLLEGEAPPPPFFPSHPNLSHTQFMRPVLACRERAEQKRLKRQLNKERRGAMRELRKDAVFLSDEKEKEKAEARAERAGAYQKAMSFLQQQESDFKSGGQGGMWKKGKGKGKK